MEGKLRIVIGPMFASKTTFGASKFSSMIVFDDIRGLYITHIIDQSSGRREMECGTTHNPMLNIRGCDRIYVDDLDIVNVEDYDVIFLDEAQFFNREDNLRYNVHKWLELGKSVIVTGLVSDVNGNKFGNIGDIIYMADEIDMLKSYCLKCKEEGKFVECSFTSKKKKDGELVEVGGSDIYYPSCRRHR